MTPKLHTERPSKHDALTQCRCAVGPASQTSQMVVQHYNNIGLVSRVFHGDDRPTYNFVIHKIRTENGFQASFPNVQRTHH